MSIKTQENSITKCIRGHEQAFKESFTPENLKVLDEITERIVQAFRRGNKIMLCGNGGSAADAQHIAAEFVGRFKRERKSLPSIALTTDTSILTAIANDYAYDLVFARQVEGLGQKGDILIAISTSGTSKNVIQAARKAKEMGIAVIGFTGKSGRELQNLSELIFLAGSEKTPHIQEMHITALHAISEAAEDILFSASE